MSDRVVWTAGWSLLLAVVMSVAAIATLADTTTEQTIAEGTTTEGTTIECRPVDVMLGRSDDCEGWPTGRAMPLLLLTAAVAAMGVPEGRRPALTRLAASLGVVVASIVVLTHLGDLTFTPRTWTLRLVRGALAAGFLPFFLLPFALRYDVVQASKARRSDQTAT